MEVSVESPAAQHNVMAMLASSRPTSDWMGFLVLTVDKSVYRNQYLLTEYVVGRGPLVYSIARYTNGTSDAGQSI